MTAVNQQSSGEINIIIGQKASRGDPPNQQVNVNPSFNGNEVNLGKSIRKQGGAFGPDQVSSSGSHPSHLRLVSARQREWNRLPTQLSPTYSQLPCERKCCLHGDVKPINPTNRLIQTSCEHLLKLTADRGPTPPRPKQEISTDAGMLTLSYKHILDAGKEWRPRFLPRSFDGNSKVTNWILWIAVKRLKGGLLKCSKAACEEEIRCHEVGGQLKRFWFGGGGQGCF